MADPYRYHRLALSPLFAKDVYDAILSVRDTLNKGEQDSFLEFILTKRLGPLWYDLLQKSNTLSLLPQPFTQKLRNITLHTASKYLFQKAALEEIDTLFNANEISYIAFKGAHTREILYDTPALRYSCDIDILISKENKIKAIRILSDSGYSFQPEEKNINSQATLSKNKIFIDLHWDILRPGRTRKGMAEQILASRQRFAIHWGPSDEATLFLMLVHPVFSEYATTPYSSLMRVVDLIKWLKKKDPDWDKVYSLLERAGLCAAGWVTLNWLYQITNTPPPQPFYDRIKPGPIKSKYLHWWVHGDYSTRLRKKPLIVQALFTLPVHDKIGDAIRAVRYLIQGKRTAREKLEKLLSKVHDQGYENSTRF